MSDSLRKRTIRLASTMPRGSEVRRKLLAILASNHQNPLNYKAGDRVMSDWMGKGTVAKVDRFGLTIHWDDGDISGAGVRSPMLSKSPGVQTIRKIGSAYEKTADWLTDMVERGVPEPTPEERRKTLMDKLHRHYSILAGNLGSRNAFPASFKSRLGSWGKHHGEKKDQLYTWHNLFLTNDDIKKNQDILNPKDVIGVWFSTQIGPGGRVYPDWGTMTTGGMQFLGNKEQDSGYRVAEEMKKYLQRL